MRKLTLITALLRPQNLLALQASIYNNLGTELPWQWIIAVDGKFVPSLKIIPPVNAHVFFCQNILKSYGFLEKNTALDLVEEDSWIYFMDDDTEVHPNFLNLFNRTLIENPNTRGMVFSQLLPDGTKRIQIPPHDVDELFVKLRERVARAEADSAHICERCGEPGVLDKSGWWKVRCAACKGAQ